jgi:hypothetical protein
MVSKFKNKYPRTIVFRLKKHAQVVENIIDKDEKVYYTFCGQRNDSSMLFDSCVVALTSKRIIIGEKRLLFGYYLLTINTKLFNDLTINSNLLWGRIEIDTVKENVFISNIDKRAMDEIETMIHEIVLNNKKREEKENKENLEKNSD